MNYNEVKLKKAAVASKYSAKVTPSFQVIFRYKWFLKYVKLFYIYSIITSLAGETKRRWL